jgi:hypothetical protein
MMTTTISGELPDKLVQTIEIYIHNQPDSPTMPVVIQTALRSFLTTQGDLPLPTKRLSEGSGYTDTAIDHDNVPDNFTTEVMEKLRMVMEEIELLMELLEKKEEEEVFG